MAERLAEGGDLAVDELKRKARRRLVGAIVLALTAAIIVPMLLEDEPRPLGDDVSVQIPARDESKFVNRLTGMADSKAPVKGTASREPKAPQADREVKPAQGDGEAKQPPRTDAEAAPTVQAAAPPVVTTSATPPVAAPVTPGMKKSLAEAEQRVLALGAKPGAKAASTPGPVEPKREPEPTTAAEAKPVTVPAAPPPPAKTATAPSAPAPTASEFVVQLAAFADDKGANALANKLKRANYAAYVEPVTTSRGTLWRVRVGGYASRPEADAARVKLKDEGYSGIVAPAK